MSKTNSEKNNEGTANPSAEAGNQTVPKKKKKEKKTYN
jgi:hypothetical protein